MSSVSEFTEAHSAPPDANASFPSYLRIVERLLSYNDASMPLPDSSKMRSEVASKNAPAEFSAAN